MSKYSNIKTRVTSRLSLAGRVAFITSAAVGFTLLFINLTILVLVGSEFEKSMDQSLLRRAHTAVESGVTQDVVKGIPPQALYLADVRVAVVRGGSFFGDSELINAIPFIGADEISVSAGITDESVRTVRIDDSFYRVAAVHAEDNTALVVAQSMESVQSAIEQLIFILLLTLVLGVAVAGLTGWAVARRGLRPVRELTFAAERVARTEELQPIEVGGPKDIARLTNSFNTMLRALDASQSLQRRLVADAGHELRTPLTSLKTNIELLILSSNSPNRPLTEIERTELLADISAQINELTALIGDLVELSRDEPVRKDPRPVDLAELVEESVERVQLRATAVRFKTDLQPWLVFGDRDELERAITNVLDNAAKWSPDNGTVSVTLHEGVLKIHDQGPGISPEDAPYVFDRFYRSHEARTLPGSGLGLSIVKRAIERHGGEISVDQNQPLGTTIIIKLPGIND